MFIKRKDGQTRTSLRLEKRRRIAKQDKIKVKQSFRFSALLPSRGGPALLVGIWEKKSRVAPHREKGLGAAGEPSAGRGRGTTPPGELPPHLPHPGGAAAGRWETAAVSPPPPLPSNDIPAASALARREAPPQPTRREPIVAGSPPSSPDRRSCEVAALTCPRPGPAPPRLPGSRSRGRRPLARCAPSSPAPQLPLSPAPG